MSKSGKLIRRLYPLINLTLLVGLIIVSNLSAQINTSKIEGVVRDSDTGQPLAGAQVVVEGTRLGNVSNKDGYYFILNVLPGRRDITFTYTGYQKTTVANQLLLAGQTSTIDANLSSTVVELEGIIVEGEKDFLMLRDNTMTKQRMTAESISATPASTLEDMMLLEAGVQSGGPEAMGRGFRIRGGRLGEELMVIDGVQVRNHSADPALHGVGYAWEQEFGSRSEDTSPLEVSASAVEEVDIFTGGFQAEYGNAQSGIVNIVTKEGGTSFRGRIRVTTDQQNPRTSDYGYNQTQLAFGGPIPYVANLRFQLSGEIQGLADRRPTHADEGFRGINQDFVNRLNAAVRNDDVMGAKEIQPVFTLEEFQAGREYYASKTGKRASLWMPDNPVRMKGNWKDRSLTTAKVTYYPVPRLKLLASHNYSRVQYSYPWGDQGDDNELVDGVVTEQTLPSRTWSAEKGDKQVDGVWTAVLPQALGRRVRTSNFLSGVDWDFYHSSERSASLQFRYSRFWTQEISNATLMDNYLHDNTFMGWTPHDARFLLDIMPNWNWPEFDSPDAKLLYPNGMSSSERDWLYEGPFAQVRAPSLYYASHRYNTENQDNFKVDIDFQWNRHNRAKMGVQATMFNNEIFELRPWRLRVDLDNRFAYSPRMYGAYIQNRTDLGDFVFDYGLRFDHFQPKDNWGFRNGDQYGEVYHPKNISSWSPRFNVAFPATERSQLRFSYGVFSQLPSLALIFSGNNYGDLEYSRTSAFEAGLTNIVGDNTVIDIVTFYRDVDGNVALKEFFRDYYRWNTERRVRDYFTGFTNRDNGNIKGMDLSLKRRFSNNFAFNVMYTLQFSRTTGSQYNTSSNLNRFLDASTGETFRPPDDIRPADFDKTHTFTFNMNYLFPEDFRQGTIEGMLLKNIRIYPLFTIHSGPPAYDFVGTQNLGALNAAEDVKWLTRRNGKPIGGINYFRTRWTYNLDLRVSKKLRLDGSRSLRIYGEVFNALNNKLPTPYPSGYNYESAHRNLTGGEVLTWSDDLPDAQKYNFNSDFNQDGVLDKMELAKGAVANGVMMSTLDKTAYGFARQIRMGVEFDF